MWLALILLTQILHREILIPAEGQSPEPKVQLVKSKWPLKDCQGMERQSGEAQSAGCVCEQQYQVCQPLQLSAMANESVTLPCHFSFPQSWEPSHHAQVHWRLGHFHSQRYLFICCWNLTHIDQDFQGRVSLAREEGQPYTASIRIVALRESDTQLYFCRVSVETKEGKKEWQTIHGTNLTVTAAQHPPKRQNDTTPPALSLHAGVLTGAVLLGAVLLLGLAILLLARGKGHGQKRTEARAAAIEEQEEEGPDGQALRCRGVQASLREKPLLPAPGEPGLVYASLVLPDALDRKRPWGTAHTPEEESPYAAVQH
ncbi:paired immunoglobulin-like type 2 receptor alpha isoform X4 [Paroedura picta]|uniref:paired immunoglobulin-like type 2 receptor alpha isoform X4 n=1 Tax=Paroedura picta TaxID=143630 RepID=UPI004055AD55